VDGGFSPRSPHDGMPDGVPFMRSHNAGNAQHDGMPELPVAQLALIVDANNRDDLARRIGGWVYDRAFQARIATLSEIPILTQEVERLRRIHEKSATKHLKTDEFREFHDPHPTRHPSHAHRLVFACGFLFFLSAIAFLCYSTANLVIAANLYPALGDNVWMAVATTGVTATCFVGGPLCLYDLKESDQDRRDFATRMTYLGIIFAVAWVVLFGIVGALDNYKLTTLTQHRFHGTLTFLNSLIPGAEGFAQFLMVPAQILGEACGAVALELKLARKKDSFRQTVIEPNPVWEELQKRVAVAEGLYTKEAGRLERLLLEAQQLEAGREMFCEQCRIWLDFFEVNAATAAGASRRQVLNEFLQRR
jgi:hypothetical protein